MQPLGTILPTAASLRADRAYCAAHAARMAALRQEAEKGQLAGTHPRFEQGEWRYYFDDDHYAIVSERSTATLTVRHFRRRADGYYYPSKE